MRLLIYKLQYITLDEKMVIKKNIYIFIIIKQTDPFASF